jgi:undecaprenyl-diphosphatase
MLEKINKIDTDLFLYINGNHNAFFDTIMYWASDKLFWFPFYFLLILFLIKIYKKESAFILISIALLITLCDQTASGLIKQTVKRLRPSHEPSLQNLIHLSEAGPGGQYGFISSHSANAFGLAIFLILLLPKKYNYLKIIILFWALLIAYSRVYNGVHYPTDVIVAAFLGMLYGWLIKLGLDKVMAMRAKRKQQQISVK